MCTLQAKVAPVWLFLPAAECNPGHPVWSRACRRPAVCASLNFFMTTWKHISKLHLKVRNVCEVIKKIMTIQCLIHIWSQTESISLFWGKLLIIPATTAGSCWGHIWLQRRPSLFYLLFLSACDAASSPLRAQTTRSRFCLVMRVNHRSTFTPSEGFLLFGGMIHCWVESVQPFNQSEWRFFFFGHLTGNGFFVLLIWTQMSGTCRDIQSELTFAHPAPCPSDHTQRNVNVLMGAFNVTLVFRVKRLFENVAFAAVWAVSLADTEAICKILASIIKT